MREQKSVEQLREEVIESRIAYVQRVDEYAALVRVARDIEPNADGTLAMARTMAADRESRAAFDRYSEVLTRFSDAIRQKHKGRKPLSE